MSYDYDYYSGRDLTYPKRPSRPTISPVATSKEARNYIDKLEVYEREAEIHKELARVYNDKLNGRLQELQTKIRDDYHITEAQFDVLWNKAWEDGHSDSLRRVVDIFDELYEIAAKFAALEVN